MPLSFTPLGDAAVLAKLGDQIDRGLNEQIHAIARAIQAGSTRGVTDVVPAYASLAVHYDPAKTNYDEIVRETRAIIESSAGMPVARGRGAVIEIPTRYDGADLEHVAARTGLSIDDVVTLHSEREYLVYMIGFAPGFAYLGELNAKLRLPRRAEPRTRVPPGSVAIAGAQTAVYPLHTPGGWHLIGMTDLVMFDPARKRPSLLSAGDRVRFVKAAQ